MDDPIALRHQELKARQAELERALAVADAQSAADAHTIDTLTWQQQSTKKSTGAPTTRVDALKRYFDAMSDFPDYNERRRQRLSTVAPFSFEKRELSRPKSAATRRVEEETQRRLEAEERELRTRFHAHPVPPTTFVPKYEMMVDEWCARKEALRILAERRAEARRIAEQPGREFAAAMQAAKPGSKPLTPEEAHAEWCRKHCKPFTARPVPKSVIMPRMAEIQVREEDRKARIASRAQELLAISRAPARMERAASADARGTTAADANTSQAAVDPKQDLQKRNKEFTFTPSVQTTVPCYEEQWAKERLRLEMRRQSRPPTSSKEFAGLRRHVTGSLTAAQEKVKRRAASVGIAVPRAASPHVAAVLLDISLDESRLKETRWPNQSSRGKVAPAKFTRPRAVSEEKLPTATRSHTLKSETAFRRIVGAEESARRAAEDEKARREKQRLANKRMATILVENGLENRTEEIIAEEARKKRQAAALQTREYQKSLKALKEQLDNQLPRFLQDAQAGAALRADAATRSAGDSQVLAMLKQHGLGEKSLRDVMLASHAAQLSGAAIDVVAVTDAAATTHLPPAPPATAVVNAVPEKARDVPPPPPPPAASAAAKKEFDSSSSSTSPASSRSSSTASHHSTR